MSGTAWRVAGLSADDLIVLSAALAALLGLFALWHAILLRDPVGRRVRALERRRAALGAAARQSRRHRMRGELRAGGRSVLRQLLGRFGALGGRRREAMRLRLSRAGLRGKDGPALHLAAKAALPVAAAVAGVLVLPLLHPGTVAPGLRLLVLAGAALAGFYAPDIYLKNATNKRQVRLRKGLPDALDLLVICAEAGLSLDAATTRVGRELAGAHPELGEEISLTALELGFLPERRQALLNLTARTGLAEVRGLVNALVQSERYGTPLAQSLRVLSGEFREARMLRAEEQAAKLPATMTVPMIVFILPALLIVIGAPAALRVIDTLSKSGM